MNEQLEDIFPSAKAPLYRRLNSDEGLSYLREGDGIIGFELDLEVDQRLSGFLLLGIQKHTIYAYKSDLHEEPKLILFPPLDKLFDSTFEMLGLQVIEKRFLDNDFVGIEMNRGSLRQLVRNLTPPEKDIDLPDDVSERMVQELERVRSAQESTKEQLAEIQEPAPEVEEVVVDDVIEEPPMNDLLDEPDMNDFDDYENNFDHFESGFEEDFEEEVVEDVVEEVVDWRIEALDDKDFASLSELGEFVELRLNVPKAVSTQVLNKALQSDVVASKNMRGQDLAVMLFKKLITDGKL